MYYTSLFRQAAAQVNNRKKNKKGKKIDSHERTMYMCNAFVLSNLGKKTIFSKYELT